MNYYLFFFLFRIHNFYFMVNYHFQHFQYFPALHLTGALLIKLKAGPQIIKSPSPIAPIFRPGVGPCTKTDNEKRKYYINFKQLSLPCHRNGNVCHFCHQGYVSCYLMFNTFAYLNFSSCDVAACIGKKEPVVMFIYEIFLAKTLCQRLYVT